MVNHNLLGRCTDLNQCVAEKCVYRQLKNALFEHDFVARERIVMQRLADIAAVKYRHQGSGNPAALDGARHAHAVVAKVGHDDVGALQFSRVSNVDGRRELVPEPAGPLPEQRAIATQTAPPAYDLSWQRLPARIVDIAVLAEGCLVANDTDFHAALKAPGYLVENESLGQ